MVRLDSGYHAFVANERLAEVFDGKPGPFFYKDHDVWVAFVREDEPTDVMEKAKNSLATTIPAPANQE